MRFITHILDIKNILGMQRIMPIPPYPANELVLRSNGHGGTVDFMPTYTGYLGVEYGGMVYNYDSSFSGTGFSIPAAEGDIIIITGNITGLDTRGQDADLLAINNTLVTLIIGADIQIIDLRNAVAIQSITIDADDADTLYAIAENTDQRDISVAIINQSSVSNGTLWIDSAQAYAVDVITAATAKGWKVRYL